MTAIHHAKFSVNKIGFVTLVPPKTQVFLVQQ